MRNVENIRYKLKFLHYTELITVSAKQNREYIRLDEIVEHIEDIAEEFQHQN